MRTMNDPAATYAKALVNLPKPGYGLGFHAQSLGVATLGVKAGLPPEEIIEDLRQAAQGGKRLEPDREIINTVRRAFADRADGRFVPKPRPCQIISNGPLVLKRIIEQGGGATEADILRASPVHIPDRPEDHAALVLQTLYHPDDFLFTGERDEPGIMGRTIRKAGEWAERFQRGRRPGPHIIANPLSGRPAPKKGGDGMTYRGDACVADFDHCVVEFDGLDWVSQLAFWSVADLPIVALIDSGGKSIHAWVSVPKLAPVSTAEEWDKHIQDELYQRLLIPLGVDAACSNPSRLSRLPGHFRAEKRRMQRLLYLALEGRRVRA